MSSLQDQLMKAGLADEKKVKQANKEKRKQKKQQGKGKPVIDEAKEAAQKALEEKAERSRELARQHNAEAEQRAIAAQIKQLVDMNRQSRQGGELPYNFTDGKKVKKIHVTEALQKHLVNGKLAIVKLDEAYELVPTQVAEKIAQRDESAVVVLNDSAHEEIDEDDPYADYKIPDDLMW